ANGLVCLHRLRRVCQQCALPRSSLVVTDPIGSQGSPVDLRRQGLESGPSSRPQESIRIVSVRERTHQLPFKTFGFPHGISAVRSLGVDPRNEEQVSSTGVQGRCAREKYVAQSVPNRADAELVARLPIGEQLDNVAHPALLFARRVEPSNL